MPPTAHRRDNTRALVSPLASWEYSFISKERHNAIPWPTPRTHAIRRRQNCFQSISDRLRVVADSARGAFDLSYRGGSASSFGSPRSSLSGLSPTKKRQIKERVEQLCQKAAEARLKDKPAAASTLLLDALKLNPGNVEIARLQARAALAAKAQRQVVQNEVDTERWLDRMSMTEAEQVSDPLLILIILIILTSSSSHPHLILT